jgi:hypothetical protein
MCYQKQADVNYYIRLNDFHDVVMETVGWKTKAFGRTEPNWKCKNKFSQLY